jgi:hypothetical protein
MFDKTAPEPDVLGMMDTAAAGLPPMLLIDMIFLSEIRVIIYRLGLEDLEETE